MTRPWWEARPGLLESELEALRQAGASPEVDHDAMRDERVVRVRLRWHAGGRVIALVAVFPDLYPFFPPVVVAPDETFARHQEPLDRALCLLGDSAQWHAHMTLAGLLAEQLPKLLTANEHAGTAAAAAVEVPLGEPLTTYHRTSPASSVIVEGGWNLDADGGQADLLVDNPAPFTSDGVPVVRAVVVEVRAHDGRVLARCDDALLRAGRSARPVTVEWSRLPTAAVAASAGDLFDTLARAGQHRPRPFRLDTAPGAPARALRHVAVAAAVVRDEVGYNRRGDLWVLPARAAESPRAGSRTAEFFLHPDLAGRDDLAERVPELRPLRGKRVVLFGLGGIGAHLALELARAQLGGMTVVDYDVLHAGNSVRWPLGVAFRGMLKVHAISNFVAANHPCTAVDPVAWAVGRPRQPGGGADAEWELLDRALDGAYAVVDATGEASVHHLLSHAARDRGLPYVYAHTTFGAWGGFVARVGATGACYWCVEHHLADGTLREPPSAGRAGAVQVTGCRDETFTGASFDAARVAQPAAQLVVSTLCEGEEGGYPAVPWDAATLTLRDPSGAIVPPAWDVARLTVHDRCSGDHR